ncbi:2-dehydropantoate 2-reductase [Thalassotalea psychrophila]|uniref:2-dehydropantoate 2-reductase n=1 Tax=Thalassotalea psychrophila TaxID=3065647 RepID=A0ABY9TRR5_9GAMM|nr:2-dehydropantoate 2-reductase [Colwelliaceae bacterium SQ149]
MKILIVGRGAMGLLFSHYLIDHDISIKSRTNSTSTTFSFTNINGLSKQCHFNSAFDTETSNADCIICCVKSYDVSTVIAKIAPYINNQCPIVLTNNGMGVIEQLQQKLNITNPIYALLTTMGAKRLSPNHIIHTGIGKNQMGLVSGSANEVQEDLINILKSSIPSFTYSEQIVTLQWQKLAINCAINALSAINDINNGELSNLNYKSTIEDVIRELIIVAEHEGVPLNFDNLICTIYDVIDKTANNSSSMREDVLKKQDTEIDFINGFIYRLGQKHKIATPTNAKLYKQIIDLTNSI